MKLEDLQPFCSTDVLRPKMAAPWVKDGFAYATNGHIGIKIKFEGENSIGDYHDLDALINACKSNTSLTIDFRKPIDFRMKPLYKVDKEEVKCKDCDGDGEVECFECGNVSECKTCLGSGLLSSTTYSSEIDKMVIDENCLIKINDAYFNPFYIDILQKFFPKMGTIIHLNTVRAMKIKFDNAEVLIMPIRVTEECEYLEIKCFSFDV